MRVTRDQLVAHVQRWSADALHAGSSWVPRFAYHFTDVQNAAAILKAGELLSRNEATRRHAMLHDNASAQVIAATTPAHLDFARLYFRPRTPTQFHNEGIRPPAERTFHSAHCPVPVFLAFDLVETLCLNHVKFSNGNMAAQGVAFSDSAELFSQIPFDLVYHEGPMDQSHSRTIVYHRNAEVLAARSLPLATLRWVGCRTHAERESLLFLLGELRSDWEKRTTTVAQRLFFKRGCCVESAVLDGSDTIRFHLHIPSSWRVHIRFELVSDHSDKTWHWKTDSWTDPVLRLTVRGHEPGVVRLFIEDCLAYVARTQPADVPF